MNKFGIVSRLVTPAAALLVATAMLPSVGAAQEQGGKAGPGDSAAKMKTFKSFKAAWNERDIKGIVESMDSNAKFTGPGAGENLNKEQFTNYLKTLFGAVPDFHVVSIPTAKMIDENTLAEEWVVAGTWTQPFAAGPLAGMPPTGKSFTLPGAGFIDFKGDKMTSVVHYFDNLSLLTQIGAIQEK